MKINIFTLFPEIFSSYLSCGVISRAFEKDICQLNLVNIRDFANNKRQDVDDYPFGGGAGMILRPDIIGNAIDSQKFNPHKNKFIITSPKGKKFDQKMAQNLSQESEISILCGRYEGIDHRVITEYKMEEISIGDYILSGGELPALTMIDAILRNIYGVLGNHDSLNEETFNDDFLEYPQYTRPREWKNHKVPDILLSGNHAKIKEWQEKNNTKININNDSKNN
ncbi:tRNA (guanosine(37)-N1)-methyltransferase TrmD [Rickettsiales bacterium]|nr:tRNA (guanosine(37)-N1)-methyltransferase TrmD [Rickettsiales bacterium]